MAGYENINLREHLEKRTEASDRRLTDLLRERDRRSWNARKLGSRRSKARCRD
jgi:hypothetical protein